MSERRIKKRQKRYARLLRRLRTAVGVSGAAYVSVASYCGPCPQGTHRAQRCETPAAIDEWREDSGGHATGLCPDLTEYARYARDRSLPVPLYLVRQSDVEGRGGAGIDEGIAGTRSGWAGPYGTGSGGAGSDDAGSDDAVSDEMASGGTGSNEIKHCCYEHIDTSRDYCAGGRPFLIDGQARVGKLQGRAPSGSGARNVALVSAWREDALQEHASIAAFARLTLELLQHGAPVELIEDSQAASLDELRHAQICKRRGAELAGAVWSFGPLATADSLKDSSLRGLLERNIIEGCIGETIAACVMRERAALAADPELRRELEQIAEDETRHATLAFHILNWALQAHPALRAEAVSLFRAELARFRALPVPSDHDAIVGTAHGHIPARAVDAVRRDVCAHVLRPLVRDLERSARVGSVGRDAPLAAHPA